MRIPQLRILLHYGLLVQMGIRQNIIIETFYTHSNIYSEFKTAMNCSNQVESVLFIFYMLSETLLAL